MPEGIGAVPGRPEGPAEAGVRAVGDDHVPGPHRLDRARSRGAGRVAPATTPVFDDGRERLRCRPERRAGLDGRGPRPSRRGRGAAPRIRRTGSRGARATPARASLPWPIDRSPSKRWNSGERLGQSHVVELADRPRGEAVAAGLLAREALLLDDEHAVAALGEPVRGRGTGRSAADHQDVVRVSRECPARTYLHMRATPSSAPTRTRNREVGGSDLTMCRWRI